MFIEKPGYCLPSCMLPPHLLSLSTRLPVVPRVCDAGSLPDSRCLLIVVCALLGRHACRYRSPESDSRVSCDIHRLHLPSFFYINFVFHAPQPIFSLFCRRLGLVVVGLSHNFVCGYTLLKYRCTQEEIQQKTI